jgi:hypothetical protein
VSPTFTLDAPEPRPRPRAPAPAHVERVLERLRARNLNPRPHPHDTLRWDADCPLCGDAFVLRDVAWEDGERRAMLFYVEPEPDILRALGLPERALFGLAEDPRAAEAAEELVVASLDGFIGVDEPGAEALLGDEDGALIPAGGDVMVYGDGGAGKTTLAVDLAFHWAAGDDWLGIPVPRPVSVLLIENEGPRALLRKKLRRKRGVGRRRARRSAAGFRAAVGRVLARHRHVARTAGRGHRRTQDRRDHRRAADADRNARRGDAAGGRRVHGARR